MSIVVLSVLIETFLLTLSIFSDLPTVGSRPGLGCLPFHLDLFQPSLSLLGLALELGNSLLGLSCLHIKLSSAPLRIYHLVFGSKGPLVRLFSYMSRLIFDFFSLLCQVLHFFLQA